MTSRPSHTDRIRTLSLHSLLAGPLLFAALPAQADTRVRFDTAEGEVSAKLGGRIQLDGNLFDSDDPDDTSTVFFRRVYIGLSGEAFGWKYKLQHDLAASGEQRNGLREVYIAHALPGGSLVLGQFNPYRGMEELASAAETLMMERPFASASGIYNGAQYTIGVGYAGDVGGVGYGLSAYNLRSAAGPDTEGVGVAGRFYYSPLRTPGRLFHIGVTSSVDNAQEDNTVVASVRPAGYKGGRYTIAEGDKRTSYGLELAGQWRRVHAQSEFVQARYDEDPSSGRDMDVRTYYAQAAYTLTGAMRPYKEGVFKKPAAGGRHGTIELTARYDFIENEDAAQMDVDSTSLGFNWIVSEQVQFMVNYSIGEVSGVGEDAKVLAARAQMTF